MGRGFWRHLFTPSEPREVRLDAAEEILLRAAANVPDRPELFNLPGVLHELRGEREAALEKYRAAYWMSPSYAPSRLNFDRLSGAGPQGPVAYGDEE